MGVRHADHPAFSFRQRRVIGKDRRGMAVGPDPHQHHIEQRPCRIEPLQTIEGVQLARVMLGAFVGVGGTGRNRMDIASGREAIEKDAACHRHVVAGVARRDEALIPDEPMHAVERNPFVVGIGCQ